MIDDEIESNDNKDDDDDDDDDDDRWRWWWSMQACQWCRGVARGGAGGRRTAPGSRVIGGANEGVTM